MRMLVVSSYPPRHCGIAAYAKAQVERWRSEGHRVTVISPPDGLGDVRVPFTNGREFEEARRRGGDHDRIVIHFQPGLHYRRGAAAALSKIRTSLALVSLVRSRPQVEILVHEATPRPPRWRPDHMLLRFAFSRAALAFHTDFERRTLERDYRIHVHARLVDHSGAVRVHGPSSKAEARRRLGLDPHQPLLVCAGFIHPWKGYDRAVRAFAEAGVGGSLAIVGSVREETTTNLTYAADLRALVHRTHGATMVEGFQTEEGFDAWVAAADRLVLPYLRAWSSGALARAHALGTPAILSDAGGLPEQAGPSDIVFFSDEELVRLIGELGDVGEHQAVRAQVLPEPNAS